MTLALLSAGGVGSGHGRVALTALFGTGIARRIERVRQ